jgi:hypothetical protein
MALIHEPIGQPMSEYSFPGSAYSSYPNYHINVLFCVAI